MPQSSPRNHGFGRSLACWLFSSSFLHKRTTFNVGRRERRVTQFQPDVFVFLFVNILHLILLTVRSSWAYCLAPSLVCSNADLRFFVPWLFPHQGPETQLFNSPWSYIPCPSAFVPRPSHLKHFLSPALHAQTRDSSVLPLLQYSIQTPLSLGRSLWSAQLESASPLFELRRIAYGPYHCRLCIITLWTPSETTFNTLELKSWTDFSLGLKIIVSSIMCEWRNNMTNRNWYSCE